VRTGIALPLLFGLAAAVIATEPISLTFGEAGQRRAWIAAEWPTADPGGRAVAGDAEIRLPTGEASPQAFVWVLDEGSGNLGRRPLAEARPGWRVAPQDLRWIGRVRVRVEHQGKPVAAAKITVNDGARRQQQLLAPSDNGELVFWAIRPGMVRIGAHYKTGGEPRDLPAMAVELEIARDRPDPVVVVAITDPVDTVAPPAEAADKPAAPPAPEARDPLGFIVVLIASLAVAGAALYGLFRWMSANRERVAARLQDLGVELPGHPSPPGATAPAAVPPRPAPVEPIVLAPAAPVHLGGAVGGVPRLTTEGGQTFELPEGESRVGRDAGLEISLPGESSVSRQHALLRRTGATVVVLDLGSTNGTYVNGVRTEGEMEVQPGDAVQFGAARFRYQV
jgi:hypothetical protein